jgi:hypothetical protein
MSQNRVDLVNIFQSVTKTLTQNQPSLDQADEYNHDHGTNMVQTFQTITNSLQQNQGKSDGTSLSNAAKNLSKTTTSGSGKLYAQGLSQAATKFSGKSVDSKGALDLLQTLIGGGQTSPQTPQSSSGDILGTLLGEISGSGQSQPTQASGSSGDILGSLLGQMTGEEQSKPTVPSQSGGNEISTLLGELTGSQPASSGSGGGLDLGDLLNAGVNYMEAKQQGGSTMQALTQAVMAASGMGDSTHRTQSTSLVVNSFLQALASSQKSN